MGGQGGFERRIEVFVKIPKKKNGEGVWRGGGGGRVRGGGQGGCEQRIEIFGKIHKKDIPGGGGGGGSEEVGVRWGVRVGGGSGWM